MISISIGGIIGSGWLFGVLRAGSIAGPAAILAWIIGGGLSLVLALSWARMTELHPRSGATVRYLFHSHGSLPGFLLAWVRILAVVTIPAIEAEAVVTALDVVTRRDPALPALTSTTLFGGSPITTLAPAGVALALGLLVFFFWLNYRGIRLLGEATKLATFWKLAVPTLTVIALLAVADLSNFGGGSAAGAGGFLPYGPASVFVAVATSGIMFAYLGFAQVVDYGEEALRPREDLPVAVLLSTAIAVLVYVLLQVAFIGAVNWNNAGIAVGRWDLLAGSSWGTLPLYAAVTAIGGGLAVALGYVLLSDAAFSPTQTGWIYLGTGARALYGLSLEGYLPATLARVHPRLRVPVPALLASLGLGALFLLPLPSWYELVAFISGALAVSYVGAPIALPAFERALGPAAGGARPFRAVAIAAAGFLVVSLVLYWTGFLVFTWLLITVGAGVVLYIAFAAPFRLGVRAAEARGVALALAVSLAFIVYGGPAYGSWTGATSVGAPVWSATSVGVNAAYLALVGGWWSAALLYLGARGRSATGVGLGAGAWFVAWLLGTYGLSYVGEFGPVAGVAAASPALPGARVVPFPWGSLLAAGWAAVAFVGLLRSATDRFDVQALAPSGDGDIVVEAPGVD